MSRGTRCAMLALVLVLAGCGGSRRAASAGSAGAMAEQPIGPAQLTPTQIQSIVMAFAENVGVRVAQACDELMVQTDDPAERELLQDVKVATYRNAINIATEANPVIALTDMAILTTLARERAPLIIGPVFGERAARLEAAYAQSDREAWALLADVASEEEMADLQGMIESWRRDNPEAVYVGRVRLTDLGAARGATPESVRPGSPSILRLLALDPLSNLDPAAKEIYESRMLAQRAFWYGQRVPTLVTEEVRLLYFKLINNPESALVLSSLTRYAEVGERLASVAESLPEAASRVREEAMEDFFARLASERAAAIEQMAGAVRLEREAIVATLDAEAAHVGETLGELRETIEAGRAMSESLNTTITSLDAMLGRVEERRVAQDKAPFEVVRLTEAAEAGERTARQVEEVVARLDALVASESWGDRSGDIDELARAMEERGSRLIGEMRWSGLMLVGIFLAGALGGMVLYRRIDLSMRRRMRMP